MQDRLRWALALFSAAVLLGSTACVALASAEGSFARTLKVSGPVDLEVDTGSGSVTVRAGGSDAVEVHARITARDSSDQRAQEKVRKIEANPPVEQNGSIIRIGRIDDPDLRRNVSISYEITTPAATRLRAHTGSGHQTLDGLQGPVDAETGSGSMDVSNIGSELRAHTGSGSINLENIKGSVRAEAGSGSITANHVAGAFTGHSGSGNIRLVQTAPGDVRVETGSGNVQIEGVKGGVRAGTGSGHIDASGEPTSFWDLHTGSGGITMNVPRGANFDLDAQTSSGGIHTDLPITMQGNVGRRRLRGKVGNGGPLVELRTGSGSIRIQ